MHQKLAQTNKKLNDVKRKCTETAKQCLQMQFENVSEKFFPCRKKWVFNNRTFHVFHSHIHQLLINSTSPKTEEIGHELGIIKSNFTREIAALKSVVSGDVLKHRCHHQDSSLASSSSTSPSRLGKLSSESIKSVTKWSEWKGNSFDDKFSTIIDDGAESRDERSDKERKRLMMKQEINNASRRNYNASINANESFGDTSDMMMLQVPQDDSLNWMNNQ